MEVKKDSKGRNLKPNEDQLPTGRYRYRYKDKNGKRKSEYSWKLVKTDKMPKGKPDEECLRDKEKRIEQDLAEGIQTTEAEKTTVYQLVMHYISTKPKLANATSENYIYHANKYIKSSDFGKITLNKIKKSDVKQYYAHLYKDKKLAVGTIQLFQNILYPAFQLAVDDSIIRKNPAKDCMKEYNKGSMSSTRIPLTREEQKALVQFVSNDNIYKRYYAMIMYMLSTGCRIGEVLGLTWNDIDFKNRKISINHQLIHKKKDGKYQFYMSEPKNKENRTIPMQSDLVAILEQYKRDTFFMSHASGCELEGYTDFVFLNKACRLNVPETVVRAFHGIRDAYNRSKEDEEVELPSFTPHTLRHTACTRYAENGIDVKVLQELMGHKNITITMQVYNHVSESRAQKAVDNVESVLAV